MVPNILSKANTLSAAQLSSADVKQKKLLCGHRHTLLSLLLDAFDGREKYSLISSLYYFLIYDSVFLFFFTFDSPLPVLKIMTFICKCSRLTQWCKEANIWLSDNDNFTLEYALFYIH